MFACRTGKSLPLVGDEIFPKGEGELGGKAFGKRESGASFGKVKFGEGEGKRKRWQKERGMTLVSFGILRLLRQVKFPLRGSEIFAQGRK